MEKPKFSYTKSVRREFVYILMIALFLISYTNDSQAQNTISGRVYIDENFDGTYNGQDKGSGAIRIRFYEDPNNNNIRDVGEALVDSVVTDGNGLFSFTTPVVGQSGSPSSRVNASTGDAMQYTIGGTTTFTNSSTLTIEPGTGNGEIGGFRFNSLSIPNGVTITSATITFKSRGNDGSDIVNWRIYAEDADNAPTFAASSNNISNRTPTTAKTVWNSTQSWSNNGIYSTPDFSNVVQEIVDRNGWSSGNSMVIIIGSDGAASGRRRIASWDRDNSTAPIINITYTTATRLDYTIQIKEADLGSNSTQYILTSENNHEATFTGNGGSNTGNDFGFLGESNLCMAIADGGNDLHVMNKLTGTNATLGSVIVSNIEAIAYNLGADTLFVANDNGLRGQLGYVDLSTGNFGAFPNQIGPGTGAFGSKPMQDVDGLTFDRFTNTLFGSVRIGVSGTDTADLLIKINRNTGAIIQDGFGTNIDYVVVSGSGIYTDIDDIAADPTDGTIYAGLTNAAGNQSQLITIDKTTGTGTLVDDNPVDDMEGLGYFNNGTFYGTTGTSSQSGNTNRFWAINKTNSNSTLISDFTENTDFESCDCLSGPGYNLAFGRVFRDNDFDGVYDIGEPGQANVRMLLYNDANNNDQIDPGESIVDSILTNSEGIYGFNIPAEGNYAIGIRNSTMPQFALFTTDEEEEASFNSIGTMDPNNNFGFETSTLPVELVTFTADKQDADVLLTWLTASEQNCSHFDVQKLNTDSEFLTIGTLSGAGYSSVDNYYNLLDENPSVGINYYRLKQVDFGGDITYSKIVNVEFDAEVLSFGLYPTLANNQITLNGALIESLDDAHMVIYDINGRLIKEVTVNYVLNEWVIDISDLPAGAYYVQIVKESNTFTQRFTKIQ